MVRAAGLEPAQSFRTEGFSYQLRLSPPRLSADAHWLVCGLDYTFTIGAVAPKNLVHFVCQNGNYEANGSHPLPNPKVDFTGLARSAGYAKCHEFSELASFEQQIGHVLGEDGPVFATLHIERTRPLTYDYPALYAAAKRQALKAELQRTSQ